MEILLQFVPYVLLALVLVLLFFKERDTFQKIALAAFTAVQKEMGTAEGEAKMTEAVLKILDALPARFVKYIDWLAALKQTDRQGLARLLAQATYDLIFKPVAQA